MTIEFKHIKNDLNGNPRYVCHFLNLLTREELDRSGEQWIPVGAKYDLALHRARKIGGRKFNNKTFGGGIMFQGYGAEDITPHIERLIAEASEGVQMNAKDEGNTAPARAVVNEKTGQYMTDSEIVELALAVLQHKFGQRTESMLNSPSAVRQYLTLRMAQLEHEVFVVIFLDSQNRAIATEELFRGTLTQTSVYPREVVKRALHHNAGGVIFAHNHPSGMAEPSAADERITSILKDALAILDIKVLDHFIVAGATTISFAERGLI